MSTNRQLPFRHRNQQTTTRILAAATALTVSIFGATTAVGQDPGSTRIRVDAAEITIGGRVQMQFNTSSADGVAPTEMLLRRVRLGVNVRINETIVGRVHPEFAGSQIALADAYMELLLSPGFSVLAGKAHRPFGTMEQMTSNQILPIERGLRIRGVDGSDLSSILSGLRYSDRDLGFQLRGAPVEAPLGLRYAVGVFAGPLQGAAGDELTQQYVARIAFTPADRLRAGIAWSRRDFRDPPPGGDGEMRAGDAFVADIEFGGPTPAPGMHIVAQAAIGDYDPFLDRRFAGAQLWAGYRAPAGGVLTLVEPLIRVSHASVDAASDGRDRGGTLLTPGVNLYFGGLNRILFNYDLWFGAAVDERAERAFRAQFQMVF